MSKNRNTNLFINPLQAWFTLAVKTGEMMMASATVISYRTGRMATAGPNPSEKDRKEFALMGQEKMDAAVESAQAMALQMMTLSPQLGVRAFEHISKGTADMLSLVSSQTVHQAVTRQAKLMKTISQSTNTATQLSDSAIEIAEQGLAPIHARVTANAKRLNQVSD